MDVAQLERCIEVLDRAAMKCVALNTAAGKGAAEDMIAGIRALEVFLKERSKKTRYKVHPVRNPINRGHPACPWCLDYIYGGQVVHREQMCRGKARCPKDMPHHHCKCKECKREWLEATVDQPSGGMSA